MSPYGPPNAHAPICDTKKQVLGLWDMSHIMSCTHLDQVAYISGSHHLTSKLIFPSPSSLEQVWVVKMVPKSRNSNSCNSQICQPHGGTRIPDPKIEDFLGNPLHSFFGCGTFTIGGIRPTRDPKYFKITDWWMQRNGKPKKQPKNPPLHKSLECHWQLRHLYISPGVKPSWSLPQNSVTYDTILGKTKIHWWWFNFAVHH